MRRILEKVEHLKMKKVCIELCTNLGSVSILDMLCLAYEHGYIRGSKRALEDFRNDFIKVTRVKK